MSHIPLAERRTTIISREQVFQWLSQLTGEMDLVAPTDVDGYIFYRKIDDADEVVLDYTKPVLSIKDVFFPPTDKLFLIEQPAGELKILPPAHSKKQVLFGVRPCDAHGLQVLDAVFINTEPSDLYYTQRRDNSILIGMACYEMGATCFCTEMGSSPDDARYMDLMLTEGDSGYTLESITERGSHLLKRFPFALEDFSTKKTAESAPPISRYPYPSQERWLEHFSDNYWEEMAERCLSCRACAYVCPTCRCFDVRDEIQTGDDGSQMYARIRCWDSCTGYAYRRIAGGHNPRPDNAQRLRNRLYCKFYYFSQQYGTDACTGCGRCIEVCPVGMDITEVLQHIAGTTVGEQNNPEELGVL